MNAYTKVSEKGQVVVPKATRDRLGWQPGTDLEVIESGDAVTLRKRSSDRTLTVEAAVARLRGIVRYDGPPIPIDRLSWSPDVEDETRR
jgi:AbrB family looped-hinge helix DNA binding protein